MVVLPVLTIWCSRMAPWVVPQLFQFVTNHFLCSYLANSLSEMVLLMKALLQARVPGDLEVDDPVAYVILALFEILVNMIFDF